MKKKYKIVLIVVLVGLGFSFFLTTLARYSSSNVWNYYLESQGFYFSSDNLSNNQVNVDTFWDGSSVHFNLKNFSNNDLISDKDITYQVSCEVIDGDETCTLNGTNNNSVNGVLSKSSRCVNDIDDVDVTLMNKTECEVAGYTWEKSLVTNDLYFDVSSESEITDVSVRITVVSTSPFRKTMTGVFNLNKSSVVAGNIDYRVNHYDNLDELIISNSYDTGKCISVSFDSSKRIIDLTNDMTVLTSDLNGYVNSFSYGLGSKSNAKFVFYSKDGLLNFNDIVVSETNEC
jgi:hypothetical protein